MDDLVETKTRILELGGTMVRDIADVPTGQMMYVRHPDGTVVEYVQWTPELVERHIRAPLRAGTPASQI